MNIVCNELMKNHTTFKIGGPCDELCEVTSEEEIIELIKYAKEKNMPYTVIGNGSNLIVSDKGIRGLVIKIAKGFDAVEVNGTKIVAKAGILLSRLANTALKHSLSGLEFASGIPGTLGGAIYMNAGAYDGEMKDVVKSVTYLKDGQICKTDNPDFGYRHSMFSNTDLIILSVEMELNSGNYDEIKAKMDDFSKDALKNSLLPNRAREVHSKDRKGYFAGKLIQDAGLKGYSIGGAMVSEKHSGFVVNTEKATCSDVLRLVEHIQKTVYDKFGVRLETEIKKLGEF